jgi:hypothetical protein
VQSDQFLSSTSELGERVPSVDRETPGDVYSKDQIVLLLDWRYASLTLASPGGHATRLGISRTSRLQLSAVHARDPSTLQKNRRDITLLFCSFAEAGQCFGLSSGWSHWCLLEFAGRTERLKPFIGSPTVRSSTEGDSPI